MEQDAKPAHLALSVVEPSYESLLLGLYSN